MIPKRVEFKSPRDIKLLQQALRARITWNIGQQGNAEGYDRVQLVHDYDRLVNMWKRLGGKTKP